MDDDPEEPPVKKYPPSPARMSKTPSWVMLGFVLGVLVGLAVQRELAPPPPVPQKQPATTSMPRSVPPGARARESLTKIEAVFADWGKYAVWDNNTTEVALWNSEDHAYSEFYEVRRFNNDVYFRSIAKLTRLVIRHGAEPPSECPLLFTETEEQYRDWREHGRFERPVGPITPPSFDAPPTTPIEQVIPSKIEPPKGSFKLPPK